MTKKEVKEREPGARFPYFNVVGPVGIGKSSLARAVFGSAEIEFIDEPFQENPFLLQFYTAVDKKLHAFDCQMFFLSIDSLAASRIRSTSVNKTVSQAGGLISDSIIETVQWKMGWISDEEHQTYRKTYSNQIGNVARYDILIATTAPESTVIQRIINRGRDMELKMNADHPDYFPAIVAEYNEWLDCQLALGTKDIYVIDLESKDFVTEGRAKDQEVIEVKNKLGYMIERDHHLNMVGHDGSPLIFPTFLIPYSEPLDVPPGISSESRRLQRR